MSVDRHQYLEKAADEVSRRTFLKGAAALGATYGVLPLLGLAPEPVSAQQSPYQVIDDNRFRIAPEVPAEMRDAIVAATRRSFDWAHLAGLHIPPDSTVTANLYPYYEGSVWNDSNGVYINTEAPGWTTYSAIPGAPMSAAREALIMGHLYTMTIQRFGGLDRIPVAWMETGTRSFVGASMVDETRQYPFSETRRGHLRIAAMESRRLDSIPSAEFNGGVPYSVAFTAVDFLASHLPGRGISFLDRYWRLLGKGMTHDETLFEVFRKTSFNEEFEEYRMRGFRLES